MSSLLEGTSPQEAAAWVAGSIALVSLVANLLLAAWLQSRREKHEVSLEPMRAEWLQKLETHKSELNDGRKKKDELIDQELERLRALLNGSQELYASTIIPLQQQVRVHMSKTRTLIGRVFVSFDRLAHLAPRLSEDDILIETTNTLDLYAEYRQHLSTDESVSYPDELRLQLTQVQDLLARIFLDLQIDEASRKDPAVAMKMQRSLAALDTLKAAATTVIEEHIRVRLDALH